MRVQAAVLLAMALTGCPLPTPLGEDAGSSSSGGSVRFDGGARPDAAVGVDAAVPGDAGNPVADAAVPGDAGNPVADAAVPRDAGSTVADAAVPGDAGSPVADASRVDAAVTPDAALGNADAADPYPGRPTGQCARDSDCPAGPMGSSCSAVAPGGACLSCAGDDLLCPGEAMCTDFGVCAFSCSGDTECPPAFSCVGSWCQIQLCVDNVCPVPWYGCGATGRCARVACGNGETCPAGTHCVGQFCVEDRGW